MASQAEGRRAFGGFIGPRTLVGLVRNTAPFLFEDGVEQKTLPEAPPDATSARRLSDLASQPLGYCEIVRRGESLPSSPTPDAPLRTDYFALCLAAHFATVATFVPTDVDTKIRDALWFEEPSDSAERARMVGLVLAAGTWDVRPVSARVVGVDGASISGHDGERLSVLCGALLACLHAGAVLEATLLEDLIDAELRREASAFESLARAGGRDRDLCIVAAHLTHNAGDVDQGLSAKGGQRFAARAKERFGRLAHERPQRYGRSFARAAAIYRAVMAPEGHRHYPLREIRVLRAHRDLLLPVSPFLDAWGERLATWPHWRARERAQVLAGLIDGCRKVPGQEGYFRALAGFDRAYSGGIAATDLAREMPASIRRELKDATLRRKVAVARESFESGVCKRARQALSLS